MGILVFKQIFEHFVLFLELLDSFEEDLVILFLLFFLSLFLSLFLLLFLLLFLFLNVILFSLILYILITQSHSEINSGLESVHLHIPIIYLIYRFLVVLYGTGFLLGFVSTVDTGTCALSCRFLYRNQLATHYISVVVTLSVELTFLIDKDTII